MHWQPLRFFTRQGMFWGTTLGLIGGAILMPLAGGLYGYVWGFGIGTLLSAIAGLLVMGVDRWFVSPITHRDLYRGVVTVICVSCALIGTWGIVKTIFVFNSPLIALLPALVAMVIAWRASHQYVDELLIKRKHQAID